MDKSKFLEFSHLFFGWITIVAHSILKLIVHSIDNWLNNDDSSCMARDEYSEKSPVNNSKPIYTMGTARTSHEALANNDYMHPLYPFDD